MTIDTDALIETWFADRLRGSATTRAGGAAVQCLLDAINDPTGLKARLRAALAPDAPPAPAAVTEEEE